MKYLSLLLILTMFMPHGAIAAADDKFVQFLDQQIRNFEKNETPAALAKDSIAGSDEYVFDEMSVQVLGNFSISLGLFRMRLTPEVDLHFRK